MFANRYDDFRGAPRSVDVQSERRFRETDRSLQCCRVSSHFLWQRRSNDRGTQLSSVQRATCSGLGRSRRVASGRATRELTFPRNKFHLVRGQITDVMRMVGAVGNYVFAVIGSPGPRRARKATTDRSKSARQMAREKGRESKK